MTGWISVNIMVRAHCCTWESDWSRVWCGCALHSKGFIKCIQIIPEKLNSNFTASVAVYIINIWNCSTLVKLSTSAIIKAIPNRVKFVLSLRICNSLTCTSVSDGNLLVHWTNVVHPCSYFCCKGVSLIACLIKAHVSIAINSQKETSIGPTKYLTPFKINMVTTCIVELNLVSNESCWAI